MIAYPGLGPPQRPRMPWGERDQDERSELGAVRRLAVGLAWLCSGAVLDGNRVGGIVCAVLAGVLCAIHLALAVAIRNERRDRYARWLQDQHTMEVGNARTAAHHRSGLTDSGY